MKRQNARRISLALVVMMLVSALSPVGAFAFKSFDLSYDSITGMLSGEVYTKDPDAVAITLEGGTVSTITYEDIHNAGFDNDNNPYYSVTYDVYVGPDVTGFTITEGTQTDSWSRGPHPDEVTGGGISYYSSQPTLDVYRMQGEEHLSTMTEANYVATGSNLFSFTPEVTVSDSVYGIHVAFPYYVDHETDDLVSTVLRNLDASDFVLTDTTVTEDVYFSALYPKNDYSFILESEQALVGGHDYVLKLSESIEGEEIYLPAEGIYSAYLRIGEIGHIPSLDITYVAAENSLRFDSLTIGDFSYHPDPTDPDEDEDNDSPGTGNGDNGGNGQGKELVNESSLKNGKDGKVAVSIANGAKQVLLPAHAAEALGENRLVLEGEELSVEIPSEVLADLGALLSEDELEGAEISFDFTEVAEEETSSLLEKAKGKEKAQLKKAGQVLEFNLSITTADGETMKLEKFSKPLVLKLKVSDEANVDLAGVYYISDEGEVEYVGGTMVDGKLVAEVYHFSKYAVLEYDKTYTDVAADFWAADVIKVMSAKHVVNGDGEAFRPDEEMSRAEFTAVIARALNLQATGEASFDDVASDAWYAEVVAAASEAGIINGKSATTFAPDENITREEMIAVVVRAAQYQSGESLTPSVVADFSDREQASDWAQTYIDAAAAASLIQGRGENQVAPKDEMTRAEGAQIAYNLFVQ